MSKNSFTKNFNSCVAGFPIASVAAHMVLHEGLLKDIGKVGALAGLGYLGYNYGDKLGEWTHDAGEWLNNKGAHIGDWNIGNTVNTIGDKLTGAHNWAKEGLQDSVLGQATGLGGPEAQQRRDYMGFYNSGADAIKKHHDAKIAEIDYQYQNNQLSAAARDAQKAEVEQKAHTAYNDLQAKSDAEAASKVKPGQQYTYKSQAQANPYDQKLNPNEVNRLNATQQASANMRAHNPQSGTDPALAGQKLTKDETQSINAAQQQSAGIRMHNPQSSSGYVNDPALGQVAGPPAPTTGQPTGQPNGQQPGTPAPAQTTGQPAVQPAATPQPGAGTTTPGQPNGQQPASGSGVDFSVQNNLKNFNPGGSFTPNQNQSRPSPFGSKQQPSKPLPPGTEVPA